jgi:hypothetical protein
MAAEAKSEWAFYGVGARSAGLACGFGDEGGLRERRGRGKETGRRGRSGKIVHLLARRVGYLAPAAPRLRRPLISRGSSCP